MSDIAIKAEGLGKKYILSHNRQESQDSLINAALHGLRNLASGRRFQEREEFWAIKDISFNISKGDRVGIIGRNGAGKSTLLKVLSRIVKPTTGRVEYEGRIASLLEVGTGFHGDLSGRENIYLNGSILGMNKREIDSKFDEIVAFSEIEKFLDTPVKRYSSGMYVRLAFAVAAHLEPEILIVDEVLAVGDSAFQKKCLGKMNDISKSHGRTILFVSHNLSAVQNLCNKSLVLKAGQVDLQISDTNQCIKHYLSEVSTISKTAIESRKDRIGEGAFRFSNILLKDGHNNQITKAQSGLDLRFEIHFKINKPALSNVTLAITIYTDEGREMFTIANALTGNEFDVTDKQSTISCFIKKFPLAGGNYVCNMIAYKDGIIQDYIQEAFALEVEEGDFFGTGKTLPYNHGASFLVEHAWKLD